MTFSNFLVTLSDSEITKLNVEEKKSRIMRHFHPDHSLKYLNSSRNRQIVLSINRHTALIIIIALPAVFKIEFVISVTRIFFVGGC